MALADAGTTINDLCDDLLCQIFDRLSVKQVMAIQRINHTFHRSAQTWFKSVDELTVANHYFSLSKSNGRPVYTFDDCFSTSRLNTFAYVYRLFNTFTGIKNVKINGSSVINSSQMVHLVSRCPNINQFELNFHNLRFDDDDWTLLVEFIKRCDIKLKVSQFGTSPNLARHLEQLFAVAERIKSVEFNNLKIDSILTIIIMMTITGLNELVEISLNFCEFADQMTEPETQSLADLVSRRVDTLKVHNKHMQNLPARVFLRLTHLLIDVACPGDTFGYSIPAGFEFPQLKRLTINDYDGTIISSFFVNVPKMERLKKLEISSTNYLMDDDQLNAVLANMTPISELKVELKECGSTQPQPGTVYLLANLFRSLCYTLARLRNVGIHIWLELVSADDFKLLMESLCFFTRRTDVTVKCEFHGGEEYREFQRLIPRFMPRNVKIKWVLRNR